MSEMINSHQCFKPISTLIGELNRHLKGGANYFSYGYPTGVYREIDWYVRSRLIRHLQRRSQRPYHPAKGEAWSTHLKRLGLVCLARPSESGTVHACGESFQESRTRDSRISGSTRGEWVAV
jgi:hypothetical protein